MFDIGASELLVVVIVAVLVIGPKDMPLALRTAGRWIGKVRRVSSHFRTGVDAMIREAELEDMEKKWQAQNEAIMARTRSDGDEDDVAMTGPPAEDGQNLSKSRAEDAIHQAEAEEAPEREKPRSEVSEPELPLSSKTGGEG